MINVYRAKDPVQAHLVLELLISKGIDAVIQDEQTFNLRGEIPVVYPSLWVPEEAEEAARKICQEFDAPQQPKSGSDSWICRTCGETIGGEFTDCWRCAEHPEEPFKDDSPFTGRKPSGWIKWAALLVSFCVFCIVGYGFWKGFSLANASRLDHEAVELLRAGDPQKALAKLNAAAGENSGNPYVYYNRAVAHSRLKHDDEAIADYTRALELGYHKPEAAYEFRAHHFFNKGDLDRARADTTRAIEIAPSAKAYAYRAFLKHESGPLEAMLDDVKAARRIDPNYDYALYLRGCVAFERGELDTADSLVAKMLARDPNSKYGNNLNGLVLVMRDQLPDAIAAFSKEIALNGADATALCNRGMCHLYQGETTECVADLSRALRINPAEMAALKYRADAYFASGDSQKAMADIDTLANIKPRYTRDYSIRGYAWAVKGDMAKALLDAEYARDTQPWNFWADYWIAAIHCARARNLPADSTGEDSRQANLEKAIAALQSGFKKGLGCWKGIRRNRDLKILEDDPRFKALVENGN